MQASIAEHPVICPIPAEAAGEISHFFGMVKDVGKGDMRQGVENIRGYFRAVEGFNSMSKRIGTWVARTVVGTIVITVLTMLALGIKQTLGK
jgi:hypothetical protein